MAVRMPPASILSLSDRKLIDSGNKPAKILTIGIAVQSVVPDQLSLTLWFPHFCLLLKYLG